VEAKVEQRRRAEAGARCSTRAPPPCSPVRRAREAGSAESTLTHAGYCTVTVRSTTSIPRPPAFNVTRGPYRLKANIFKRLSSRHEEVKEVPSITTLNPKSPSQAHLQNPEGVMIKVERSKICNSVRTKSERFVMVSSLLCHGIRLCRRFRYVLFG